jgi:hypothetical protein
VGAQYGWVLEGLGKPRRCSPDSPPPLRLAARHSAPPVCSRLLWVARAPSCIGVPCVISTCTNPGPQTVAAQPRLPSDAWKLLPRGRALGGGAPAPAFFSDLRGRGGAFTVLNCELLARFAKCSEQLREATYLAKSTPLQKKWSSHLLIHRALLPSPPPLLPPSPFLLPPFCTPSLPLISPLSKTAVLPSVAQNVKRSAGVSWSPRSAA